MSYLKVIEQPQLRGVRFRYECEGRSTGGLYGASTKAGQKTKTFPTVELIDHEGPAFLVISCVTRDPPYFPHPHKVIQSGGQFSEGICYLKIPAGEPRVVLKNLCIQCTKKKDIKSALEARERIRVDPFKTGFEHREHPDRIDVTCVRLCFQVFIEGTTPGSFNVPLRPVVSEPIYDKKQAAELAILYRSHAACSVAGGTEMCILADKVCKDEVDVKFFDSNGWEAYVETVTPHFHKQVAITFRSPAYIMQDLEVPVTVKMQLVRNSDGQVSKPVDFMYYPLNPDENGLPRKRQRVRESPTALVERHLKAEREKNSTLIKLAQESQKTNQEQLHQQQQQPCKNLMSQPAQHQLHYENPLTQQQVHQQIQQVQKNQQQPHMQQLQQQQQRYQQQQGINNIVDPVLQRQMQLLQIQHNAKFQFTKPPICLN